MSGKAVLGFTVSVLLMAGAVAALADETAAPPEAVTVTANKSRLIFHEFSKVFEAPSKITGKLPRWGRRICPIVLGQNAHFTAFITQRVKYVALAVGARIDPRPTCKPNIEIVFTTTPQDLINNVRRTDPNYLGYAETSAQLEALTKVTKPIQAWYTTETGDFYGRRLVDSVLVSSVNGPLMFAPPEYGSSGSRIADGIESGFNHIIIVLDSTKLAGQKIVPLADYVSMLALTQLSSLDACQPAVRPSIVNMMAEGCDHGVDGLTQFDLAYLKGLYWMSPDRKLMFQRNDIADTMTDTLANAQ